MTNRSSRSRCTAHFLFAAQLLFSALLATTFFDPADVGATGVMTNCDEASPASLLS